MRKSDERILTTHVGSIPRNAALRDLLVKQDRGEAGAFLCPRRRQAFDGTPCGVQHRRGRALAARRPAAPLHGFVHREGPGVWQQLADPALDLAQVGQLLGRRLAVGTLGITGAGDAQLDLAALEAGGE